MSSFGYLIKEGFKNVWVNRMMSLASVCVLISCLLLTGTAVLFTINVGHVMQNMDGQNVITVFLSQDSTPEQSRRTGEEIESISNIDECKFVDKDEALNKYSEMFGSLFDDLRQEDNFLPDSYQITLKDSDLYDQTISEIKSLSHVDTISDRSDAANKLASLNMLVRTVGFWVMVILSAISLFIISNTIRMTMYSRRLEISIMKSVGATNSFIRVPFVVEGIIIGVISAFISMGLITVLYNSAMKAIHSIMPFSQIPFNTLSGGIFMSFIAAGILFGAIGGIISISKYLKKEGGEILGW